MLLKKEKTGISVEEEYKTLKCIEEIYNTAQENIRVKIDDFIETLFDKNEIFEDYITDSTRGLFQ
ncbi:hypothetical protein [Leptospira interrogans]|uniref:hypothetical protein n=1 Tax=Leptospira interrogans TaxID=173 RepID=UPI001CE28C05|nr:hypothetical protein [Leptospira interrogans]